MAEKNYKHSHMRVFVVFSISVIHFVNKTLSLSTDRFIFSISLLIEAVFYAIIYTIVINKF